MFFIQNEGDLKLELGDIIEVIEKTDHGWWLGKTINSNPPLSGYFPKNYVRERSIASVPPPLPPRPASLSSNGREGSGSSKSNNSSKTIAEINSQLNQMALASSMNDYLDEESAGQPFSLDSLDAFDDLMNNGVAVEVFQGLLPASETAFIEGMIVDVQVKGLTWNGTSNLAYEYAEGTLRIEVGHGQLCPGLEYAVKSLKMPSNFNHESQQEASSYKVDIRVTCSPDMAYGEAGLPPLIAPSTHVVFLITSITLWPKSSHSHLLSTGSVPQGPMELLPENLPRNRKGATSLLKQTRRLSSVLLVNEDEVVDSSKSGN